MKGGNKAQTSHPELMSLGVRTWHKVGARFTAKVKQAIDVLVALL